MKLVRPALALALGASLTLAGVAEAKIVPKPVCNLITDVKGNGSVDIEGGVGTPNDDRLDILSADIATSPPSVKTKRKITTVFRLGKADGTSPSPGGTNYNFYFTAPGIPNRLFMEYFTGNKLLGPSYSVGYDDPVQGLSTLAPADGFINTAKNEIHISAFVDDFDGEGGGPIKTGAKLTDLEADTSVNGLIVILYANQAVGSKSYVVGQSSCVTAGK